MNVQAIVSLIAGAIVQRSIGVMIGVVIVVVMATMMVPILVMMLVTYSVAMHKEARERSCRNRKRHTDCRGERKNDGHRPNEGDV